MKIDSGLRFTDCWVVFWIAVLFSSIVAADQTVGESITGTVSEVTYRNAVIVDTESGPVEVKPNRILCNSIYSDCQYNDVHAALIELLVRQTVVVHGLELLFGGLYSGDIIAPNGENVSVILLERGLVSLKGSDSPPPEWLAIEDSAKQNCLGMWGPVVFVKKGVNLRASPSLNSNVIRRTGEGEEHKSSLCKESWYRVGTDPELWVHESVVAVGEENIKKAQQTEREGAIIAAIQSGAKLQINHWQFSQKGRYVITKGEVKNISSGRIKNVMAVVSFYSDEEAFITSCDSFVEFNPVMPGQTTPFEIICRWNPLISTGSLRFKEFGGPEVKSFVPPRAASS